MYKNSKFQIILSLALICVLSFGINLKVIATDTNNSNDVEEMEFNIELTDPDKNQKNENKNGKEKTEDGDHVPGEADEKKEGEPEYKCMAIGCDENDNTPKKFKYYITIKTKKGQKTFFHGSDSIPEKYWPAIRWFSTNSLSDQNYDEGEIGTTLNIAELKRNAKDYLNKKVTLNGKVGRGMSYITSEKRVPKPLALSEVITDFIGKKMFYKNWIISDNSGFIQVKGMFPRPFYSNHKVQIEGFLKRSKGKYYIKATSVDNLTLVERHIHKHQTEIAKKLYEEKFDNDKKEKYDDYTAMEFLKEANKGPYLHDKVPAMKKFYSGIYDEAIKQGKWKELVKEAKEEYMSGGINLTPGLGVLKKGLDILF